MSRFKSIIELATSSALVSALPIVTAPINSRMYSPSDYGVFGASVAIATLAGVFCHGLFSQILFLQKDQAKASTCFRQGLSVVAIVSASFTLLLLMKATGVLFSSSSWLSIAFIPPMILFGGVNALLSAWANRSSRFSCLARSRSITVISCAATQISAGLVSSGPLGLFLGTLTGAFLSSAFLIRCALAGDRSLLGWARPVDILRTFAEFRSLLGFGLVSDFLNNLSNQLPIILLSNTFGNASVGLFNMGNRLVNTAISPVLTTACDVFRSRAARRFNSNICCRKLVLQTSITVFLLCLIPAIPCIIWAPQLVTLFLGEEWVGVADIARILGGLAVVKAACSPVTFVMILAKKFVYCLLMDVLVFCSILCSLYIGFYQLHSLHAGLILYVSTFIPLYFISLGMAWVFAEAMVLMLTELTNAAKHESLIARNSVII